MGTKASASAQFSIYKINIEEAEHAFPMEKCEDRNKYATKLANAIIAEIARSPKLSERYRVSYNGFYGVFFKTTHDPAWCGIARQMISGNEYPEDQDAPSKFFLKNTNVSYVLCYVYSGQIYAVTGGYGSNYIGKLTEKNYGLYLLPKFIDRDNPVVKSLSQNNLLGNHTSTQKTNKKNTTIFLEQDMGSIFRQVNIEADRDTAEDMGIEFDDDESDSKKIGFINKDSFVIRRSLSLHELKVVIHNLSDIEKEPDKFPLNYLVPARKKRLKNADLFNVLVEALINREFERFVLTGDDYTTFYTGADKYVLRDEDGNELINTTAPILFSQVIDQITNPKLSKGSICAMLKQWTLSTYDNTGRPIMYRATIFDSIQGFIEFGNDRRPCYLFNGLWYVFDEKFSDLLTQEFEELYRNQEDTVNTLSAAFGLRFAAKHENDYNDALQKFPNIVVAHTVLLDNLEIADGIFWDEHSVYLMHNKASFSGAGTRDVTNQVLTAAEYLQQRLARYDRISFLESYYDKISAKYQSNKETLCVTKEDFVNALNSGRTFHYVTGYIQNYSSNSDATYAKYLTVETAKRLSAKGYKYSVMSTSP